MYCKKLQLNNIYKLIYNGKEKRKPIHNTTYHCMCSVNDDLKLINLKN